MTDYSLASAPRMTFDRFAAVLRAHNSPAAPVALGCWDAIVAHGIDPALALAQFERESTFGTAGVATANRSWGNLRTSPDYPSSGGFVRYPSWPSGAADYARLLAGPLYAQSDKYSSALTMPYRYAPAADHNAPAAYGAFLVLRIGQYIAGGLPRYTAHFRPGAAVRSYKLSSTGCIVSWTDSTWGKRSSSAPATGPEHRRTCRGSSGAMTTRILGGVYRGQWIRCGVDGVTVGRS